MESNRKQTESILKPVYDFIARVWNHPRVPLTLWILWALTRLAHLAAISNTPVVKVLTIDALHYHEFAKRFMEHGWGNEVWFMNPGYPTFVGILYWLVTASPLLVMAIQTILEGVALALTLSLGRRWLAEPAVRLAMLIWVGYSVFPYYNGTLLTTTLILVLNIAVVYQIVVAQERSSWWRYGVAGLLLGLSILCRPIPLLFIPVIVLFWFIHRQSHPGWIKHTGLLITGVLLAVLPFSYRNYLITGQFVLTQTSGGVVFWIGNNPDANGIYQEVSFLTSAEPEQEESDYRSEASRRAGKELTATEASHYWYRSALGWMTSHPFDYLKLQTSKLLFLGNRVEVPNNISIYAVQNFSKVVKKLPFGWSFLLILFPVGVLAIWKQRKAWLTVSAILLTYLLANLLFYTASEYRFPMVPFMILLAGAGLYWFAQKITERNTDYIMGAIMLLVPGFLLSQFNNRYLMNVTNPRADYFNWAQVSLRQGDQFEALKYYQQTLAIDPFYIEGHYQLAALYHEMGFDELSRAELTRIGMSPTDILPDLLPSVPVDSGGKVDKSKLEEMYRKLLKEGEGGDRIRLLMALGTTLQDRKEFGEAKQVLLEAATLDTTLTEAKLRIAQIELEQKDLSSSLQRVEKILEDEGDNVLANIMKYHVLKQMNRSKEAEDHLQFLKETSIRDAGWQRILYNRLHEPLGFEPGPELRSVVPDTLDTPNSGNW